MRMRLLLVPCLAVLVGLPALADEPSDREEIIVPPPPPVVERPAPQPAPEPVIVVDEAPVAAPPPPFVELERRSLAAGIGIQWGRGALGFEGRRVPFRVTGVSVGDLGAARLHAIGDVENLREAADLEGLYLAVEAGAAAGPGRSVLRMRNEKGVVITLRSRVQGGQLSLGAKGLRITLE